MTTKRKAQTFAERMLAEAREIESTDWVFGRAFVSNGLEEQLVEGLKAFAKLWFLEHTDEVYLPAQYYRMIELIDQWRLADTAELEDDEDED